MKTYSHCSLFFISINTIFSPYFFTPIFSFPLSFLSSLLRFPTFSLVYIFFPLMFPLPHVFSSFACHDHSVQMIPPTSPFSVLCILISATPPIIFYIFIYNSILLLTSKTLLKYLISSAFTLVSGS